MRELLFGFRPATLLLFPLVLLGCDGGSSATAPLPMQALDPDSAVLELSVSPDPLVEGASPDPDYEVMVSWTLTIRETAGLAGNIDSIAITLRDTTFGFDVGTLHYGPDALVARAGTNRIEANGALEFPLSVLYTPPPDRDKAMYHRVEFGDVKGNHIVAEKTVDIR